MKHMKKFTAMLLAVIMVLGMALSASAADENDSTDGYTITIKHANATQKHTYGAYQIFTGDLHTTTGEDNKEVKVLSNIVWGSGITEEGKTALLAEYEVNTAAELAEKLDDEADAKAFAELVADHLTTVYVASNTEDNKNYAIDVTDAGYYLIKDMDTITGHDSYTRYMMKVVADVEATHKNSVPTVDKQVLDETTDAEVGATDGWGETADHNLNESFEFKLIANLPEEIAFDAYDTYKVVFNDTMSEGITFEEIVSVTVDGIPLNADQYVREVDKENSQSWTLTIENIKTITGVTLTDGAVIEVIYKAHLNEKAVIGNKPDNNNKVFLEYSNNPNATCEGEELGKTNEDTVWVFTYEIDATKVDGDTKEPLADAEFKLYRVNNEGKNEYVTLNDKGEVTGWIVETEENKGTVIKTGPEGLVKITGLDHGTYYLEETKAPAGYNSLKAPVEIIISAEHAESVDTSTATTNVTFKKDQQVATNITIENNAGVELPETGGMGTTMFYAVGAVLVLAAVVLLVTKRRMRAE